MTDTKIADLIGLSEIAELYGVDTNTANGWRRRKDFPKPVHQLRMGPMWDKEQILEWRTPIEDYSISLVIPCFYCGSPLTTLDPNGRWGKCGNGCHDTEIAVELKDGQVRFSTSLPF